jgi:hypothetical protein
MKKSEYKVLRLSLEWGAVVAVVIALIAGKDTIAKGGVIGLCVFGSAALIVAFWEHGWLRAPIPVGTPIRASFLIVIAIGSMTLLGWLVFPKPAEDRNAETKLPTEEPFIDPPVIASDAEKLPHVDLSKRALIKAAPGDGYFCRPGGGGITEAHIMIGLINLGIPTSLGGWQLRYESPRLKHSFKYTEIDDHDVCGDHKLVFKFNRANSIYEQTDKRIETNTKYRGWARFQVPGFLYHEIGTKEVQLTIEFSDDQGKQYTVTYIGNGNANGDPHYYPGVPSPLTKADPGSADVKWCLPKPIENIPWGFTAGYCNFGPSTAKQFDSFASERAVISKDVRNHKYLAEEQKKFLLFAKHVLELDPRPADVESGHNRHGTIIARPVDVPSIQKGAKIVVLRGYVHWNDSTGRHETDTCVWLKPPTMPPRKDKPEELVWNDCSLF